MIDLAQAMKQFEVLAAAMVVDLAQAMKQLEVLDAKYISLRKSHDRLLTAAKGVRDEGFFMLDHHHGRIDVADHDKIMSNLCAAISKAEQLS